ncbi:hypothetical protein LCGC14_1685780 [marine sediment metagenome]|uniref:Uncharacterized protein n=1 Tax=marine sediment metagenome TaxID=412755 RepID=A0A0F9KMC2_9ZZZZ
MMGDAMKEWERDELPKERDKRVAWKNGFGNAPSVARWLSANPPPNDWDGDPLDWAFLEMPFAPR